MKIQLTHGQVAVIDEGDFVIVSAFRWRASWHARMRSYYATASGKLPDGRTTTIYMHRLITGCPPGKEVDHFNHKTLDNRRINLRVGSHRDNMKNGKWALTTHCPRGHAYDLKNTLVNRKGKRICRECARLRMEEVLANETPKEREVRRRRVSNYYQKNREAIIAQTREYTSTRKDAKRAYDKARRERLKGAA